MLDIIRRGFGWSGGSVLYHPTHEKSLVKYIRSGNQREVTPQTNHTNPGLRGSYGNS